MIWKEKLWLCIFTIILCLFHFVSVNAHGKEINCSEMSFEEFQKLDYKKKIEIYLCRYNYGGWHHSLADQWAEEIAKEGEKIIPELKEIVEASRFEKDSAGRWDHTLYILGGIISYAFIEYKYLSDEDRSWFIEEYEKKLIEYLKKYKYIGGLVEDIDLFIEHLKDPDYIRDFYWEDVGRYLYKKYSEKGIKDLKLADFFMFPEYEEYKKKYNK